ncbi:MAG: ATP-dependent Clp protease ATP-binding subunit [Brumimicrobium sp.]|nr:ATP-dependent Clp protease ATP-binding subunit [Brumimicrobium sp.]
MENELLFFERADFSSFKELKKTEGYDIVSITEYIKDNSLIEQIDPLSEIVDLTALSGYNNLQTFAEGLLILFEQSSIVFIADNKFEDIFRYEFRYCFNSFENWESAPETNVATKLDGKKQKLPKNQHKKITDLSEDELGLFFKNFRESLYGHEKFKDDFFELTKTFRVFNGIKEHKILSLFLLGESGVGKTEVANSIYKCLGGKKKLAKVNFGNYSSEFSLSSLIGSARGYIGSDDGEIFIRVRDTDIGVILIDEFEKSNATLFNYFLDVLESGKLVSSLAEEIDLDGFIIVFTSNISKEDFSNKISPELRSRFDYKCQFTLLYNEDKKKYVEFRVNSIVRKVNEKYKIQLEENLHERFLTQINVSDYNNMRDLNKKIKTVFVDYVTSEQLTLHELEKEISE